MIHKCGLRKKKESFTRKRTKLTFPDYSSHNSEINSLLEDMET